MIQKKALVLGGGGITGIAWESGVLAGLLENGVDVRSADKIFGTSAGSFVGAILSNNKNMKDYYHYLYENRDSSEQTQLKPEIYEMWKQAFIQGKDNQARIGQLFGEIITKAKPIVSMDQRKQAILKRLDDADWTSQLAVTTINARTGNLEVFDRQTNIPLIDAVAASGAVPGLWPHVSFKGENWIDGGMVSSANATIASEYENILIIAPLTQKLGAVPNVFEDAEMLSETHNVVTITPDANSQKAISENIYDASRIIEAGNAGYKQGQQLTKLVNELSPIWLSKQ